MKLGFGGGCHWCTEAVFDHLKGVSEVQQGWIKSLPPEDNFSEAVLIEFDPEVIPMEVLVQIHLLTHASTANHSMREKYRSAFYFFDSVHKIEIDRLLAKAEKENGETYVTKVLPFAAFTLNSEEFLHYYQTRPEAPFCETHIQPKLLKLMELHGEHIKKVHL